MALGGQEVAGGGAAGIHLFYYKTAMWNLVDQPVFLNALLIGRGIVGYDDFVVDFRLFGHLLELSDKVNTDRIIDGNEDRKLFFSRFHAPKLLKIRDKGKYSC